VHDCFRPSSRTLSGLRPPPPRLRTYDDLNPFQTRLLLRGRPEQDLRRAGVQRRLTAVADQVVEQGPVRDVHRKSGTVMA